MTNTISLNLVATKTKIAVEISAIDCDNVRVLQPNSCCKGVSHSKWKKPKGRPNFQAKVSIAVKVYTDSGLNGKCDRPTVGEPTSSLV